MSAAREAVFLPLCLLTVALLGGLQPGSREPLAAPPLFTLVLAVLLMAALVRSGTVHGHRLLHGSRSVLENANGVSVMVTLFAASAQLFNLMTPRAGLPMVTVSTGLFVLLLNTLVAAPDRVRVLRSLLVICSAAFVLKFIVLDGLADPEGGRVRRLLTALFDVATLGTVSQEPLSPLAGYIAFFTIALYLVGVALLPHGGPDATGESRIAISDVGHSGPPSR